MSHNRSQASTARAARVLAGGVARRFRRGGLRHARAFANERGGRQCERRGEDQGRGPGSGGPEDRGAPKSDDRRRLHRLGRQQHRGVHRLQSGELLTRLDGQQADHRGRAALRPGVDDGRLARQRRRRTVRHSALQPRRAGTGRHGQMVRLGAQGGGGGRGGGRPHRWPG